MAKIDDQLHRIHATLCRAFHELPSVLWSPIHSEEDGKEDKYWLSLARASAPGLSAIVGVWSATGKWPILDERSAYFLRVRIESAARIVASQCQPDRSEACLQSPQPETGDLETIRELLLEDWTEESDLAWAERAANEDHPPEVFLPLPRGDLSIGDPVDDFVVFPFEKLKKK